jgi:hypothetical protein
MFNGKGFICNRFQSGSKLINAREHISANIKNFIPHAPKPRFPL